jgi:hypothetical protein
MRDEKDVVRAARHVLNRDKRFRLGSPYNDADLPLFLGRRRVGLVEVKPPWDCVGGSNAWKSLYRGLGQLMYHGRALDPELPLALFIGAWDFEDDRLHPRFDKPILTRARTRYDDEAAVREKLAALGVDLILCAQMEDEYIPDGGEELFLQRVEAYAKRFPERT